MQTENQKITVQGYFKALQIVHLSLIIGLVLFLAIVSYLISIKGAFLEDETLYPYFRIIAAIFFVIGLFFSRFIFQRKNAQTKNRSSLLDKLNSYRSNTMIRLAFLEGPGFFSVVCYMLTGEWIFTVMAGMIIFFMLIIRPNPYKTISDIGLSIEEAKVLNNPDALIE